MRHESEESLALERVGSSVLGYGRPLLQWKNEKSSLDLNKPTARAETVDTLKSIQVAIAMTTNSGRPNVLLLLTDDQGWDDLSLHGNEILETPNLDAFARDSVRFANYYVASVCAPSRASLLTGRHFMRTGVAHVHGGKDFVHPEEIMMGQHFQAAGYRTGMWGKWHSGRTTGYFPWERGFDEAYMAQLYKHFESRGQFNGETREHDGWTVDTLVDYAIEFMEREKDGPFFAFLPFLTCHTPLKAPTELVEKYVQRGLSEPLATLYGMVDQLDNAFGRLMAAVDQLGLAEDTVVLFMSDNGPACCENLFSDDDRRTRYVNGYKGHKGNMWENGIKSPLFVRWPGRFRPHTVQRLCDICDILPTLLDICAINLPAHPLDGRSILPYLQGDEDSLPPKESYVYVSPGWPPDPTVGYDVGGRFNEYDPVAPEEKAFVPALPQLITVRTETHKLLRNPGKVPGMPEVIDGEVLIGIEDDPKEDHNIILTNPHHATKMRERLLAWFEELKREPHSFHTPVFAIGPNTTNIVYAYAPVRVRGQVRTAGLSSPGWSTKGDGADFHVKVTQAGSYSVQLEATAEADADAMLALRIGDAETLLRIEGGEVVASAELALKEGEQTMHVEVAGSNGNAIFKRLTAFRLSPAT